MCSGNPLFPSGDFFNAARSTTWQIVTIPAAEHPNVREGRTVIPGGPAAESIVRMAEIWGVDSNTYRSRVLSDFPTSDAEGLFDPVWIDRAVEAWESKALEGQVQADPVPRAALDVAHYGPDGNVLAIRQGPVVRKLVSWGGLDLMQTVDRTTRELSAVRMRPESGWKYAGAWGSIEVDVCRLGAGVADRLKELGGGESVSSTGGPSDVRRAGS